MTNAGEAGVEPASPSPRAGCRTTTGLLIGIIAALAFVGLTVVRLDAQGAYYDELFQAPAAFVHLGTSPEMFATGVVNGYPMMNMEYIGAIKSHLYGLFLRWREKFDLGEWRMLGILLVAAGIVGFSMLAAPALPPLGLGLLLLLLVTDGSVLLLGRHDFGPVDLALALRLLLVGLWLRGEVVGPSRRNSFALGAVSGVAIFEKLSSVALLVPLALFMATNPRRRDRWQLAACAFGLAAGLLPLLVINVASYASSRTLFSLSNPGYGAGGDHSWKGLVTAVRGTLDMGAGCEAAQKILGLPPVPRLALVEALFAATILLFATVTMLRYVCRLPAARWSVVALASFPGVTVAIFMLPPRTWIHHWIVAAPFLYLGVALALTAALQATRQTGRATGVWALALLAAGWLACRAPVVMRIERALAVGSASRAFHPSLSRLGEFAAARRDQAIFVASDWGVAIQIYCFANGRPGFVFQPFANYEGVDSLNRVQKRSGKRLLYIVRLEPPSNTYPEATARIEADLAADARWREEPVEPEAAGLEAVNVRKFVYLGGRTNLAAASAPNPGAIRDPALRDAR